MGSAGDGRAFPALDELNWYRTLFDVMPDAILVADHKGRYVDANQAAMALFGYSIDELRTMHISALSTLGLETATEMHQFLVQEGVWAGQGKLRCKDGSLVPVEVRTTEVIGETATFYMGIFRPLIDAGS